MIIDRRGLVRRHNPVIRHVESLSPLSVGNGEFAFTADITGLQSFPGHYDIPLGTQSQWGWHSSNGKNAHALSQLRFETFDTYGRPVGYPSSSQGQEELFHWLRKNPHRLQLGQFGLRLLGSDQDPVQIDQLHDVEQTLDLWSGLLISEYKVEGAPVKVLTCCHPHSDQFGVSIESPLLQTGRLEITIQFPSPEPQSDNWSNSISLNWSQEGSHQTLCLHDSDRNAVFERAMQEDGYRVSVAWSSGVLKQVGAHSFRLIPHEPVGQLELVAGFTPRNEAFSLSPFSEIRAASEKHWESFWTTGGVVELSGSQDARAYELERRIVLSQFLTAIHCAGSLPPQETGLLYNSWFGKFHLEMHWWHAAHFAFWGRIELLKRSLSWYRHILPAAKDYAATQGYHGARWPKMVGPDGRESPSPVGNLLIWQQPHPILYAEYCYQAESTRETLEYFKDIVMESAEFMASFAVWDGQQRRYVLGPPVIPAQENHKATVTLNPTFELEYWRHGLDLALRWRKRLGLDDEPTWRHVRDHLASLPVSSGLYMAHERCPDTFTKFNTDHPAMLGALGLLPGKMVDREIMRRTLRRVVQDWQWETAWGWDFPMAAMTAARLGETALAVDLLLMETAKNTYLPNGHNYQRSNLMAYLPGNGGLLAAVGMMACGWQDAPGRQAPGFPADGTWTVRWEGLNAWL